MLKKLTRLLLKSILFIGLLLLFSEPSSAQVVEVVVEDPVLHPAYTTCPESYWYPFANNRGHTAYLTLNVDSPANSTNYGDWHPLIPQAGYYKVEAYIAAHTAIPWCTGSRTIAHDTTQARYSIHHANGVTTRDLSQYPLSNQWLDLGEYYFNAGQSGYIHLADLNGETEFSTTISFSAMRFTFTRLIRPNTYLPFILYTDPSVPPPGDVGEIQDQGFDACHLPEISEMQAWWNHSPYAFYALYMGGIHLPSFCSRASAAWVSAVHQQGWSFLPTWVGPQAPCSTWAHKMSSDPAVSYQQGRQEAQAASSAAASMGLANDGMGGTIIYYDMEAYGVPSNACRQPVAAFINGWVERLHELGNLAGAYGTRNTYPADWASVQNPPDDIWAASWYSSVYDPYATVNGISWIEGLWTNHQRIRQYAGDVGNTWGGVSLSIDIDVADGMVAMPPAIPHSTPVITTTPSIEDVGWVSPDIGWLVSESRLYITTDQGKLWQDVSPAEVLMADFLPSGEAWVLSAPNTEGMDLYHSVNWGLSWVNTELSLPPGNWRPLQVKFTSPTSGWVVLQMQTSQAFDVGLFLKTNNGGVFWQRVALPTAAPIQFSSEAEGWQMDRNTGALHRTTDGGLTWQPSRHDRYTLSQPAVPENSVLAGWQADGLGWAATSTGSCRGEKFDPGFACQVENDLWQTLDGGQTWHNITLPRLTRITP
jgi:photosystem II stability/assembly factor-like uncharacterized protein